MTASLTFAKKKLNRLGHSIRKLSSVIISKSVKLDHVPTFQFHFDRPLAGRQILYEYLSILTCHLVQKRSILQEAGSSETIFTLMLSSPGTAQHDTWGLRSTQGLLTADRVPQPQPVKDFQKNGQRLLGIPPCTNICYFIHFHFLTINKLSEKLRKVSIDENLN